MIVRSDRLIWSTWVSGSSAEATQVLCRSICLTQLRCTMCIQTIICKAYTMGKGSITCQSTSPPFASLMQYWDSSVCWRWQIFPVCLLADLSPKSSPRICAGSDSLFGSKTFWVSHHILASNILVLISTPSFSSTASAEPDMLTMLAEG